MYQFKRKQLVKTDISTCWEFFSSPDNLSKITPKYMGFDVLTDVPDRMYEGLMIEYRVRPLLGIPMRWITEITHVKDYQYFVDEQRLGPYTIWHHEHHFQETEEGIEMTDIVSYQVPFGILGRIAHPIIVQKKLAEIFDYRFKVVEELFNQKK
jgi:ligand-binding SRPBCC domain-containing protein